MRSEFKILITGASGFLGQNLVQALLKEDVQVIALCRSKLSISASNLKQIICDLSNGSYLFDLPKDIDAIVHLAQSNGYQLGLKAAEDLFNINVKSTFELIQWAYSNNVKKFIFSSTGSVYLNKESANHENNPCEPSDFYSATKLCAENLLRPFGISLDIIVYRIYYLYGKNQKNKLISNIHQKIMYGHEITLDSVNGLIFNPLHIDNGVAIILEELLRKPIKSFRLYNLAGKETISLESLIHIISNMTGSKPIIKKQNNNNKVIVGNIELLTKEYNINKFYSIQEGLEKTYS